MTHPFDSRRLTDAQRQKLSDMLYSALLEIRILGRLGRAVQAADLADAFHNVPNGMWADTFSLTFLRDTFLLPYCKKYPERLVCDYVAMVDEMIRAPAGERT